MLGTMRVLPTWLIAIRKSEGFIKVVKELKCFISAYIQMYGIRINESR